MANRFMPGQTHVFGRKPRRFRATFVVNGAANPAIVFPTTLAGAGFARAERTAAGIMQFELSDVWPNAVYEYGCTFGDGADNNDMYTQCFPFVNPSTGRIMLIVRFKTAAVNTDPPNAGNISVWIELESAP